METDDDALFGGGGDVDPQPTKTAENLKRTAAPVETLSEAGTKARKRRAARAGAIDEPRLATAGLLGIPTVSVNRNL